MSIDDKKARRGLLVLAIIFVVLCTLSYCSSSQAHIKVNQDNLTNHAKDTDDSYSQVECDYQDIKVSAVKNKDNSLDLSSNDISPSCHS